MNKYFFKGLDNKKIIIFGTGKMAKCISNKLLNSVAYYVDNNEQKWGTTFYNIAVRSPSEIKNESNDFVIIVASMYYQEILVQLKNYGFNENNQVINGSLLFVNPLNEELETAIIKEYNLFSEKIRAYLQLGFIEDIGQFLTNYDSIVPLDERIDIIREIWSMEDKEICSIKLKSMIENIVSNSNPNFDLYYEYNLAMQFEKKGDYVKVLNYFEKILARGVSKNHQQIIIEKINQIEKNYKKEILQQLNEEKKLLDNKDGTYVHLMIDNFYCNKFIEFIKEHFNKEEHVFIFLSENKDLQYIEEDNLEDVITFNHAHLHYGTNSEFLLNIINCSRKVFIHYLTDVVCKFICKYEIKTELNWVLWGADLYSYLEFDLYDDLTKQFLNEIGLSSPYLNNDVKKNFDYYLRKGAIRKIHNILTWNTGDYKLVREHFITNAEQKPFFYPNPVDFQILDKVLKNDVKGTYDFSSYDYVFLVGNSGTPTNNHLEIFQLLKKYLDFNICIVVPLSYGDPVYIRELIKIGYEIFGEKFVPLTQFFSPAEYSIILNQVDVAFFNHSRQQGVGNIWALLYLNKIVSLKNEVTTFFTFSEQNFKIWSLNDFKTISIEDLNLLIQNSKKEESNKLCMMLNYSSHRCIQNVSNLLGKEEKHE